MEKQTFDQWTNSICELLLLIDNRVRNFLIAANYCTGDPAYYFPLFITKAIPTSSPVCSAH